MRRRLRAVLRNLDRETTLPPGLLLIGGRPTLAEHTFDQLTTEVSTMIEQMRRTPASSA